MEAHQLATGSGRRACAVKYDFTFTFRETEPEEKQPLDQMSMESLPDETQGSVLGRVCISANDI